MEGFVRYACAARPYFDAQMIWFFYQIIICFVSTAKFFIQDVKVFKVRLY